MPSPPQGIHRQMAVTVTENGTVRLLGYTPQDELATTVGEFEFLDVDAGSPDEVRVVPRLARRDGYPRVSGSLSHTQVFRDVPAIPRGLPTARRVHETRLSSSRTRRISIMRPTGSANCHRPRTRLTRGPGLTFSPSVWRDRAVPESPCWQWEVIGRLTINDDAPAQPVATPPTFVCDADPTADPFIVERARTNARRDRLNRPCRPVRSGRTTARNQSGVFVENPDGDLRTLLVNWSGNPCDLASTFTFTGRWRRLRVERTAAERRLHRALGAPRASASTSSAMSMPQLSAGRCRPTAPQSSRHARLPASPAAHMRTLVRRPSRMKRTSSSVVRSQSQSRTRVSL